MKPKMLHLKYLGILILTIMLFQSCTPKRRTEERIIRHFKEEYDVDVKVVKLTRAYHLNINTFQYTIAFVQNQTIAISGLYKPKHDYFYPIDIEHAVFNYNISKVINEQHSFTKSVTSVDFWVSQANKSDYKNETIYSLSKMYKSDCRFFIHIYCFDYNEKDTVDWNKFTPVIDYFKKFPETRFYFAFSFYPPEIFNEKDIYSNDFGFSFKHVSFDTSFEGVNIDKRLDHIEASDISLDSLLTLWNNKLNGELIE